MKNIKLAIASEISALLGEVSTPAEIAALFEYPPEKEMGDLALPCFRFSKALRKAPVMIASGVAESLKSPLINDIKAVNGYLNIYLDDEKVASQILGDILARGDQYGAEDVGKGGAVTMDYSSPNIAKPFHMGHLSSTIIGESLKRLLTYRGYKAIGINHLGDWGTQFGKQIVAYKLWGDDAKIESGGVNELVAIYVRFHKEAETNPVLNDEAREWFAKLERGDEEATRLWKWFCEISMREVERVYKRLKVSFDYYVGESFYSDRMPAVVEELRAKNLLKIDQGASIVDLEKYNMPPCLILKSNGSTLYPARDIATALYRHETFNFVKSLYVTDYAQNLHFAQWFAVIREMGYDWADDLVHIPFGRVSIEGSAMSTREGNMLPLIEVMDTAVEKVRAIIEQKNPGLADKDEVAQNVGIGAVVFNSLSNGRIRDIDFRWDEALNFDGNTGPYVQYTYARTCSLIKKAGEQANTAISGFTSPYERELVMCLAMFPEKIDAALRDYEPSIITRYLLDICAAFNRMYNNCPILKSEGAVRDLRVSLTKAANVILGKGLELICMEKTENI